MRHVHRTVDIFGKYAGSQTILCVITPIQYVFRIGELQDRLNRTKYLQQRHHHENMFQLLYGKVIVL